MHLQSEGNRSKVPEMVEKRKRVQGMKNYGRGSFLWKGGGDEKACRTKLRNPVRKDWKEGSREKGERKIDEGNQGIIRTQSGNTCEEGRKCDKARMRMKKRYVN